MPSRITLLLSMLPLIVTGNAHAQQDADGIAFFESNIRPVLVKHCYGCHSDRGGSIRGGLRLDSPSRMLVGGDSGEAIVPGDPDASPLYRAIAYDGLEMPPSGPLAASIAEDFRHWIRIGAPTGDSNADVEIRSAITGEEIAAAKRAHWAYQTPVDHEPPAVGDDQWPRSSIDAFVVSKLESAGLAPAEDAPSHTLVRRLYFDLIGLPPTPSQVDDFAAAHRRSPATAVSELVEKLLASEQFGERFARHWLDLARYAESSGREVNFTYPAAWRYRDYVIDSFNADKPLDRFIQEQIAGDLLPGDGTVGDEAERRIATTFLALGPKVLNEPNARQFDADLVDEQIDVVTRVFLGTSVACARCHDHKFDAIPQTDYYAMAGIFQSTRTFFGTPANRLSPIRQAGIRRTSTLIELPGYDDTSANRSLSAAEMRQLRQRRDDLRRQLADLGPRNPNNNRTRTRLTTQIATINGRLAFVDSSGRPKRFCMGVADRPDAADANLLVRGEIDEPAQTVERGFPAVLGGGAIDVSDGESGRLQLARFIGSDDNPLAARVLVNRVWKHLIGEGIVRSTEDFGVTGDPPTHPELLDHLTVNFVRDGWSLKRLVRRIVNSRTYQMASTFHPDAHLADPDNRLLWRHTPRRLDAESIRDAMLTMSGTLDLERPDGSIVADAGFVRVRDGSLVNPRQQIARLREQFTSRLRQARSRRDRMSAEEIRRTIRERAAQASNQLDANEWTHRSIYMPIVRDQEPRSLTVFDLADTSITTGVRESSNTADQALYLLNHPFVIEQGERLAEWLLWSETTPRDRIDLAFRITLGRSPSSGERSAAGRLLRDVAGDQDALAAYAQLCQGLFATAEFRLLN